MKKPAIIIALLLLSVIVIIFVVRIIGSSQGLNLYAQYVDKDPKIDGAADDKVWDEASELKISVGKKGFLDIKSVYTEKNISFFLSWPDKTKNDREGPWKFNGKEWLKEPHDDRVAFLWNMEDSIAYFNIKGCDSLCHKPEKEDKASWYMATNMRDEKADEWRWMAGVSDHVGIVDDRFMVALHDEENVMAAHKADVGISGYLRNGIKFGIALKFGDKPILKLKENLVLDDIPYPRENQLTPIVSYKEFKAGDKLPFVYFTGEKPESSRADIKSKGVWKNGRWALEIQRKLDTRDDSSDIIFRPSSKEDVEYLFAIALFDNPKTDGDHYFKSKPVKLILKSAD